MSPPNIHNHTRLHVPWKNKTKMLTIQPCANTTSTRSKHTRIQKLPGRCMIAVPTATYREKEKYSRLTQLQPKSHSNSFGVVARRHRSFLSITLNIALKLSVYNLNNPHSATPKASQTRIDILYVHVPAEVDLNRASQSFQSVSHFNHTQIRFNLLTYILSRSHCPVIVTPTSFKNAIDACSYQTRLEQYIRRAR